MSFYVYVLRSLSSDKLYIGQTVNLELRLKRHNGETKGRKNCYTHKNLGPWEIVYKEEYSSRAEAIKREKELKSFRGREFVNKTLGR